MLTILLKPPMAVTADIPHSMAIRAWLPEARVEREFRRFLDDLMLMAAKEE
jgi:hypothetical protein